MKHIKSPEEIDQIIALHRSVCPPTRPKPRSVSSVVFPEERPPTLEEWKKYILRSRYPKLKLN